jgi:hypothetical protein
VGTCGAAAETLTSAERFRGCAPGGTGPTQRDYGTRDPGIRRPGPCLVQKTGAGSVSRCQAVLVLMVAVEAKPVVKADRDLIRCVYLEIDRTGAVVGGPFGQATHDV